MKKTLLLVICVVILIGGLFVLTGCGDNKTSQNSSNTAETTNNTQIEATEFYVQNLVPNTTIKELYASVTNAETWTPNLLGTFEMSTGTQAKIGLGLTESTKVWDIKVVDEEGTEAVFSSIDLSAILEKKSGSVALQMDENNQLTAVVK